MSHATYWTHHSSRFYLVGLKQCSTYGKNIWTALAKILLHSCRVKRHKASSLVKQSCNLIKSHIKREQDQKIAINVVNPRIKGKLTYNSHIWEHIMTLITAYLGRSVASRGSTGSQNKLCNTVDRSLQAPSPYIRTPSWKQKTVMTQHGTGRPFPEGWSWSLTSVYS